MDRELVRDNILGLHTKRRLTYEAAGEEFLIGIGRSSDPQARSLVDEIISEIREEARRASLLDRDVSVAGPNGYKDRIADEARSVPWYSPEVQRETGQQNWDTFRSQLEHTGADYVGDLDTQSNTIVGELAEPYVRGLKKKGLVLGHVQSGKTANYTAVIAKALDAGYRLVIVFSGMYTNLRRQTQSRLLQDLQVEHSRTIHPLTTIENDIGYSPSLDAFFAGGTAALAVVKKNHKRLERLRNMLRDLSNRTREELPVLIIDDEADQATPNTSKNVIEESTTINRLMKEIWTEVRTGTYVGYTATPFANVFMNPNDDEELYPSDFIKVIPRSPGYFGTERIFGLNSSEADDQPVEGLDMVRGVPESDSEALRPPTRKVDQENYLPSVPESLEDAIFWLVISTAISRARGLDKHSSMLVHVTHYTGPHFLLARQIKEFVETLDSSDPRFGFTFEREKDRASEVRTRPMPLFGDVHTYLESVLNDLKVVVDNGQSEDRLDYTERDSDGKPVAQTVIAVGGATLSRGLTLEGLIVSYFTRTANKYDTLLQMGRWFGYRDGYEDLPRIWMPIRLQQDFRFLAGVEDEMRTDIREMISDGYTPRQLGVPVRAHPGRLDITAKMGTAGAVALSYSRQRKQTITFDEQDAETLDHNLVWTRQLIHTIGVPSFEESKGNRIARGVDSSVIGEFVNHYWFYQDRASMNGELMAKWIRERAQEQRWNVVVVGPSPKVEGGEWQGVDLGFTKASHYINRAPLRQFEDRANIKALLSDGDWVVDLDPIAVKDTKTELKKQKLKTSSAGNVNKTVRHRMTNDGLLLIYPLDPHSKPQGAALQVLDDNGQSITRRPMCAVADVIGLGIIFPRADKRVMKLKDADYYAVTSDWSVPVDELELPEDNEGDSKSPVYSV